MKQSRLVRVANTLILRGLGSGVAVLLTVLVTRYLSTPQAAEFLLVLNIATVGAVCFRWGLDDVIVRGVASSSPRDRGDLYSRLTWLAHRRVVLLSVLSAFITCIAWTLAKDRFDLVLVLVAVGVSGLVALAACAGRVLQGEGKTNTATVVLNVVTPALAVLGLLVMVLFEQTPTAWTMTAMYACAAVAVYFVVVLLRSSIRPRASWLKARTDGHKITNARDRRSANLLGGAVLSQQALSWGALLLVPLAYGDRIFTSFMVTYKVSMLIGLVMLAVNFTFAARLAFLHSAGRMVEFMRLVRAMTVGVFLTSGIAAAIVYAIRNVVYEFSDVDVQLNTVLLIVMLAQVFFSVGAVMALVLTMSRDESYLLAAQGGIMGLGLVAFATTCFTAPIEVAVGVLAATYFIAASVLAMRVRTTFANSRSETLRSPTVVS